MFKDVIRAGGGGTAIYGLYVHAAVKGRVFKQFTMG